ncbi:PPE domain-containing protein, partial [Mycobacterium ulcerans]
MNFAVLPPEINSVRMFSGAGSEPMLAAAAWDGLSAELGAAAESFALVTSGLAGVGQAWQGAAASAMVAAAG